MINLNKVKLIHLPKINDKKSQMVFYSYNNVLPFKIKNSFLIKSKKYGINRGNHSHKKTSQFIICIAGKCKINITNGKNKKSYLLNNLTKGVLVPPLIWCSQEYYTQNTILLCHADRYFDEKDYIRDFNEYLKKINV